MLPTVDVRGLPITACCMDDVRLILADAISGVTGTCRIATINLSFLRQADARPEVRAALQTFEHRLADGWPVLELARLAGTPLPERVTGASLVPAILGWARAEGWKIALVGGLPETRTALAKDGRWDDVICGHWMPEYRDEQAVHDPAICAAIRAAGADIVLVALGCPKQELWLNANLAACGADVGLGIGGSLEFLAGIRSRAPLWVQWLRCEFLYRMLQEPRRLGGRYYADWCYWRQVRGMAQAAGAG